jgi:Leucine-rich repeat (LRR) protein
MSAVITSITGLQNLPNLVTFNADYNGLSAVNLSNLSNLQYVDVSDNNVPGSSINSLTSVNLSGSTSVVELRLDDSEFSGGIPNVSGLTSLQLIDLDQCSIPGILDFSGLPAITNIDVFGNAGLTSVIISSAQLIIYFGGSGCGLTETAVDDILVALDDNGEANGTVFLDGGTNAIPSATGLAAVTNLQGKGWTVIVNS